MTPQQKMELYTKKLRPFRDDPIGFCRYILGIDPHEGQQKWLTAGRVERSNVLVTGNRWGKSTIAACKLIWRCVYKSGWTKAIAGDMAVKHQPYRAINICRTADQAHIVWGNAFGLLQNGKASWLLEEKNGGGVVHTPFPKMTFATGSILEARSTTRNGEHLLGNAFDVINWDEVAFEKNFNAIREGVLRMRLVDRAGTIDYTSTGNGRNEFGLFFLEAFGGRLPSVYAQNGSSFENTKIDRELFLAEIAHMSPKMRAQNIDGAIIDGGGEYFGQVELEDAYDPSLDVMLRETFDDEAQTNWAELQPNGKPWREEYPSHKYLCAWDPAEKVDWAVGTVWDVSEERITLVEFRRFRRQGWDAVYDAIRKMDKKYGGRCTVFDGTGLGDVLLNELKDIKARDIKFTKKSKDDMLTNIQSMLALRQIRWPNVRVLRSELAWYERDDKGLQTDCVMSAAVGLHFANKKHCVSSFSFGAVKSRPVPAMRDRPTSVFSFRSR